MTYENLPGESDRQREQRHQREYDAYAAELKDLGVEPVNFTNWNTSRKFNEKIDKGERPTERRNGHR